MEIWDAYYKDGTKAGCDLIRDEVIPTGLYLLVCEILVRHIDGDYLLMQRDMSKPNDAGRYEASAGGSALKGEASLSCAKRELFEETGIKSDSFIEIGRSTTHNTIYHLYLCTTDCDKTSISLQKDETMSYKWLCEKDFIHFINSNEIIKSQKERYYSYFVKKGYILK